MEGHEGRLKLEIAPFNKNPTKAGGYFVLLVWAVVPLRHCTGARSHQHQETKYPPVVCYQLLFMVFCTYS